MKNIQLLCFLLFFAINFSHSQETTGKLEGKVTSINGELLPYASIVIIDSETNFKYGTSTQESGYYIFTDLPPGDYYEVTVSYVGFKKTVLSNVKIDLGKITKIDFQLIESKNQLDEITITSKPVKKINEQIISKKKILNTPTITRSIQDLTRNLPEANLNSFAGASNRFNNLNIDGISNNDVIGFQEPSSGAAGSSANGSPGSLARTQPIGFGAIKQLSVKTTPFDVSIGNFSGANIDVVTKNGTNTNKTSIYSFGNNQNLVGSFANGSKQEVESFYDFQVGFGNGGAIIKDKLFYYINFEQVASSNPILNAPGTSNSNINLIDVQRISEKLISDYNYNPGSFSEANIKTNSTKLFVRLDFNLSEKNKLTLRNNFVKSFADNLEWNESIFNFGNQGFRHNSIANSFTAELNSKFENNSSNLLSLGNNYGKEGRDFEGDVFPHLQISDASNRIFAGTYREASVYNTKLNTFQINDKFTFIKNGHTFNLGGLIQYNDIDYGFLSAWNGRWEYNSVENFLKDQPSRIRGVYRLNNNNFDFVQNTPSATVDVLVAGLYLQDRFRVNDNLTLTAGLRLDTQFLLDDLPLSNEVENTPEFSQYKNEIRTAPHLNPRFGFEYILDKKNQIKLSGGSGLFTGRLPYLWFAYAEYISGTEYFNIDVRPNQTQSIVNQVSQLGNGNTIAEINLIDTDFELPREWKTNLSLDMKLPKNYAFKFSGSYTKTIKGIFFKSINRKNNKLNFEGSDNRAYFAETGDDIKINPNFTNVFLLSNSNDGYRYNFTFGLSKNETNYSSYLGYTYGKSKDVSSTVRSSPAANFEWNQVINSNNPSLSFSNFDLRHKIVSTQSFNFNISKNSNLQASFLYNGTSGTPFSFVYQGDVNRDGSSRNDLIYIPKNTSEINLLDIVDANGIVIKSAQEQWNALDNFIENNLYLRENRGSYSERNGPKTPWNHRLDSKFTYKIKIDHKKSLDLSLDIFNVFNLINKNWGRLVFVPNVVNSNFSLLRFKGVKDNEPQFQFDVSDNTPWVVDNQNSRWLMQIGVTFNF